MDYIPDIGRWLAVWNGCESPFSARGAWVDTVGSVLLGGSYPLVRGNAISGHVIAATHSTLGGDQPRVFSSSGSGGGPGGVYTRGIPEPFSSNVEGETDVRDFLQTSVSDQGWNVFAALPDPDVGLGISIHSPLWFFSGVPLAESNEYGTGHAEVIAVAGHNTGAEELHFLLELSRLEPHTYRVERAVSSPFSTIHDHGEVSGNISAVDDVVDAWNLEVTGDDQYIVSVWPLSEDPDLRVAVFDAGDVPAAQYRGLADRLQDFSFTNSVLFTAPDSDTVGIAVWVRSGSGGYRLVVSRVGAPTTEEIVAALLGHIAKWPQFDINGDGPVDVADVVENLEAGR